MKTPWLSVALLGVVLWGTAVTSAQAPAPPPPPAAPSQLDETQIQTSIEALGDKNPRVRLMAAERIKQAGPRAKAAIPALTEMLQDPEDTIRLAACIALGSMGNEAVSAVPALEALATDKNKNVAGAARGAINAIKPAPMSELKEDMFLIVPAAVASIVLIGALIFVGTRLWSNSKKEESAGVAGSARLPAKEASFGGTSNPPIAPKETPAASVSGASGSMASGRVSGQISQQRGSRALNSQQLGRSGEREGADKIKTDLSRAQEEFNAVCEDQKAVSESLAVAERKENAEQIKSLRKQTEELATRHYKAAVRVKAFEVKMIEALMSAGISDATLRAKSEAALKTRWDELRTMCEHPVLKAWKDGRWAEANLPPLDPISDIRVFLREEFSVELPEPKEVEQKAASEESPEVQQESSESATQT